MRKSSTVQRTDYDGTWKVALDRYLEPFLRLCFPAVHAVIDWSHDPIPLDQELQEVVKDAGIAEHRVDKLFQVKYPSCKLLDLDRAMLERENNPAAVVILAHRIAQERRSDPVQREASKWALTRQLYEQGHRKEDVQELFRVIDWLVRT
jgi:hypothetical protein